MDTDSNKSKLIRVGVIITASENWIGGLNYFKNLINAVYQLSDRKIEFVIFSNKNNTLKNTLDHNLQIVQSDMFNRFSFKWLIRKLTTHFFNTDPLLTSLLRKQNIDILSHSGGLNKTSSIPTIGWIPDFQHIHLPMFFSEKNRRRRDKEFARINELCTKIILSSKDAEKDMHEFAPSSKDKTVVLNFAINPTIANPVKQLIPLSLLQSRYHFSAPFFLLPNQFWAHKNHQVVIEAIHLLKPKFPNVLVLATGNTADTRNPLHFGKLMQDVNNRGLKNNFKVCGIIPSDDLYALMRYSIAIINPSLFEGWSTSVEEAKVFGKTILLSDIPVHKEQNPQNAYYFDPGNPAELAQLISNQLTVGTVSEPSEVHFLEAKNNYMLFAHRYQTIVEQVNHQRQLSNG